MVPAEGNGDLQTLTCVLVARPRRCPAQMSGLEVWRKGNINENCLCLKVLCTIIMVHKDTSSSYRSVDCIGL